jgi:hypothetical protein
VYYLAISIVLLVCLNLAVSIYLFNRNDLDVFQKIVQVTVVWLISFFGAIGLWLFNRSHFSDNDKLGGSRLGGGSQGGIGASISAD